jgi:uncharacterized protein DUF6627
MKSVKRWISRVLIVCMAVMGVPFPASAGVVSTDQVAAGAERDSVRAFLDRQEVRAKLQTLGVDADAARARVDALTDQEAKDLAARIDQLPAGGDILGLIFVVFIILLITDILGLTKVFPFTRSVR